MKLESELYAEFVAAAEAIRRPESQVLRELMREFIQLQREARDYDEFLRYKVETGRASMRVKQGRSNDDVEVEFAARRAYESRNFPIEQFWDSWFNRKKVGNDFTTERDQPIHQRCQRADQQIASRRQGDSNP